MQYSLITPQALFQETQVSLRASQTISETRKAAGRILQGQDKRLLVIAGPCSIHDPIAALEYANLLQQAAIRFADELVIIMRVYFEKPRTALGWKGLISDPLLNNSFDINKGLRWARELLIQLGDLGVPAGTEFLDTLIPYYISDLISWSVIGARTAESQVHRELASGLAMPVGFKNGTDGNIKIAIDAAQVARHPHHFIGLNKEGAPSIVKTTGNPASHIILRGSHTHTNYDSSQVKTAATALNAAALAPYLIIDCSHGNSQKDYQRQIMAAQSITAQIKNGSQTIAGIMLESHLVAGKQLLRSGQPLMYGQSITDGCISWADTAPLLEELASAVKVRNY